MAAQDDPLLEWWPESMPLNLDGALGVEQQDVDLLADIDAQEQAVASADQAVVQQEQAQQQAQDSKAAFATQQHGVSHLDAFQVGRTSWCSGWARGAPRVTGGSGAG